jgi:hypothetical protein
MEILEIEEMTNKIEMGKRYKTDVRDDIRILCVDGPGLKPVVGIYSDGTVFTRLADGRMYMGEKSEYDLTEIIEPETRTIWVNVYKRQVSSYQTEQDARFAANKITALAVAVPVTFEFTRVVK